MIRYALHYNIIESNLGYNLYYNRIMAELDYFCTCRNNSSHQNYQIYQICIGYTKIMFFLLPKILLEYFILKSFILNEKPEILRRPYFMYFSLI